MSNNTENKNPSNSSKVNFQRLTDKFVSNSTGFAAYSKASAGGFVFDKNIFRLGLGDLDINKNGSQLRVDPKVVFTKRKLPTPLRLDVLHADEDEVIERHQLSHYALFGKMSLKRNFFVPLVANYLNTLNITGFNPNHSFINLVYDFKVKEESSQIIDEREVSADLKRFKLFKVSGTNWSANSGPRNDGFTDRLALHSIDNDYKMQDVIKSNVRVASVAHDSKILNSQAHSYYSHDPFTDGYVYDLEKVRDNLANYYSKSREKINFLMAHQSLLPSALTSLIEFGTFLRILLDCYKGNFSNVDTIGNKLGIIDSTTKQVLNADRSTKDSFASAMSFLSAVVSKLPFNEVVWSEYENNKKSWVNANLDLDDATTILNVPVFEVTSTNGDHGLKWFDVKAHASVSKWKVPFGSMVFHFLKSLKFVHKKYPVSHITENGATLTTENVDDHSYLNLSYVRMTEAAYQILANLMYNTETVETLKEILYNLGGFINELTVSECLKDTSFKFGVYEWDEVFVKFNVHESPEKLEKDTYLTYDVQSLRHFPLITNSADLSVPKVKVYAGVGSLQCPMDTSVKAFVVSNTKDDNLELKGIALENPVLMKFSSEYSYFGFNTMPYAKAEKIAFTNGSNQYVYSTPIVFEWTPINNSIIQSLNMDRSVSLPCNIPSIGYLATVNCQIFDKLDADWGRFQHYIFQNYPDMPILHTAFSETGSSPVKNISGVTQYSYFADWVISKGTGVRLVGFEPIKPTPRKDKKYF